jgi:hypothetical protein
MAEAFNQILNADFSRFASREDFLGIFEGTVHFA